MITFDEVRDLGLHWSFLQVLDHHVGNSGQVTHVASSGATFSPEMDKNTQLAENLYCNTLTTVYNAINI